MRWGIALGLAGALIIQVALVGWMIVDRAMLLANGTEVRLAAEPVDPRALFRGDYVTLSYGFSQFDFDAVAGGRAFAEGDAVYVTLEPGEDAWAVAAISAEPPAAGVFLRGTISDVDERTSRYAATFNLERFFVPEGTGREIEQIREDQPLSVDAAIGADGRAGLKRLLVDGEVRFEEPLY